MGLAKKENLNDEKISEKESHLAMQYEKEMKKGKKKVSNESKFCY